MIPIIRVLYPFDETFYFRWEPYGYTIHNPHTPMPVSVHLSKKGQLEEQKTKRVIANGDGLIITQNHGIKEAKRLKYWSEGKHLIFE